MQRWQINAMVANQFNGIKAIQWWQITSTVSNQVNGVKII